MGFFAPHLKVGIDIGGYSIKLVALNKKNSSLYHLDTRRFIDDRIAKEPNDINCTLVGSVLEELIHKIPGKNATFNLSISVPFNNLFIIDIPYVNDNEIKEAIYWDLGALLPNQVDDYEYDFQVIDKNRKAKTITTMAGAIPKETINNVLSSMEKYAKNIPVIEIDLLSLLDRYIDTTYDKKHTVGFLNLGAQHSTYAIISESSPPNFLSLPFGGNALDAMISNHLNIPFISANEQRHNGDLYNRIYKDNEEELDPLERKIVDAIVTFIKTIIQYNTRYKNNTGEIVSEIVINGGLVNDYFIKDVFNMKNLFLNTRCTFWEPFSSLLSDTEIELKDRFNYGTALGIAMRE